LRSVIIAHIAHPQDSQWPGNTLAPVTSYLRREPNALGDP